MEGSINETEQRQWAGVFITDIGKNAEVEKAFAMSEPPAHDDWQPKAAQALTPHQRTYVTVALRRIRERISTLSGSNISQGGLPGGEARSSLAALAGDIGRSLIGAGPGGADGSRPSSSSGNGGRKPLSVSDHRCRKEQASATVSLWHASGSVSLARVIPARQSPSHHWYRWMRGPEILSLRTESHPR